MLPVHETAISGRSLTRHNFVANVFDGALFSLGLSFVSFQTILPVFVLKLGGTNVAVGLLPVLWTFGFSFPQILISGYSQKTVKKKALLLKTAMGQRIPWLLLAVFAFGINSLGTEIRLTLFFLGYLLAAVGGSFNLPVWFDLIAELTPVTMRGRLFGTRLIMGALFGVVGGAVATYVLGTMIYPRSYGVLFLMAFGAMMCSYVFLAILREPPRGGTIRSTGRSSLRQMTALLRDRPAYRRFIIADALLISGSLANGFFAVHALGKFLLSEAFAGIFTVIMTTTNIVGSMAFGVLADRYGHKINLVGAASTIVLAALVALCAPTMETYALAFVCLACSISLVGISRLPFIAELCTEAERPSMIAVTNLLTSPFILVGVVAGWVADSVGYEAVFFMAGAVSLSAVLWLLLRVEEPRTITILPGGHIQ